MRMSGGDAHVTVGLHRPDGQVSAAAIIHLVKYGSGQERAVGGGRHRRHHPHP